MSSTASTTAQTLARTLRAAGITRMFGLPGGEILEFIHAAKAEGIDFLLTRHEAAAAFIADVSGQIGRRPAVCVSTLGPGAVNMTLGVANAFLDRSPVVAITASTSKAAEPYATHQNLDLNAVYRPFTKMSLTLDGIDTAAKVRLALRSAMAFGAERASIFRLIVGRGLLLASIGSVIGVAAALGIMRTISGLLVGVKASDPPTFVAITVLFLAVSAVACGLPAYRASRLDPTAALRAE